MTWWWKWPSCVLVRFRATWFILICVGAAAKNPLSIPMRRFAKFSVKRWVFRCFRNKRWRWQLSLRDLLQGKPTRFDARSRRGSATAIASRSSAMHWSRAWWRAGIHASLPCKCSRRSKASLDTDFPNRTRRVSRCWCTRAAGSNAIIPRRSRRRCSTVNRWGSTRRR